MHWAVQCVHSIDAIGSSLPVTATAAVSFSRSLPDTSNNLIIASIHVYDTFHAPLFLHFMSRDELLMLHLQECVQLAPLDACIAFICISHALAIQVVAVNTSFFRPMQNARLQHGLCPVIRGVLFIFFVCCFTVETYYSLSFAVQIQM